MIKERMSQNFSQLHTTTPIADARELVGVHYGIVHDEDGQLVSLLKADDLSTFAGERVLGEVLGQLPPAVAVWAGETMEAFVQSPPYAAMSIGARGAVVYEEENIVGILTFETLIDYLQFEFEPAGEVKGVLSATRLPGKIKDKPLIMYCEDYNHRNELQYYNRHNPPQCCVTEPRKHPIRR